MLAELGHAACSAGQVSNDLALNFRTSFNLPGQVQSVGRGELLALSVLVKHLLFYSEVISVTGSRNLRNTYNKGPRAGSNSSSCDLLEDIL